MCGSADAYAPTENLILAFRALIYRFTAQRRQNLLGVLQGKVPMQRGDRRSHNWSGEGCAGKNFYLVAKRHRRLHAECSERNILVERKLVSADQLGYGFRPP